jgi:hypothetical protein
MADEKWYLTAFGAYMLGYNLERLEWAIATVDDCPELASFFGDLRIYEGINPFEDIGREAKDFHNLVSSLKKEELENKKNSLRDARARWHTLARERLQNLYLVTPRSRMDPKCLMKGIKGFLRDEHFALLEQIEVSDLNEACMCILVISTTAAEHIALRAAESLLRRWYEYKTGNRLSRGTWGTVLDKLVQKYPENSRPKEINLLGYLKQRRDEVAHPQRVSSLIEAEATLLNVCSLIEGIKPVLAELASLKEPDAQLPISEIGELTKSEEQ